MKLILNKTRLQTNKYNQMSLISRIKINVFPQLLQVGTVKTIDKNNFIVSKEIAKIIFK